MTRHELENRLNDAHIDWVDALTDLHTLVSRIRLNGYSTDGNDKAVLSALCDACDKAESAYAELSSMYNDLYGEDGEDEYGEEFEEEEDEDEEEDE